MRGSRRHAIAALSVPLVRGRWSPGVVALAAAAPALLLVARLLPENGVGLALRLAAATACVLVLPGALLLRAGGWPESLGVAAAAAVALSLAVLSVGLALVFAVGTSLVLALLVVAAAAVAAAVPAALAGVPHVERTEWLVAAGVVAAAAALAGVVWWAAGGIQGDALFHLARARKLGELDTLTALGDVNEFADGSLHPGYAFPLWHAVLALVAQLAGVDTTLVVLHLASALVPLAFLVAYGAGEALFGSRAGGLAVLAAYVGQLGFARDGIGSFQFLALPATSSRLLLAPAVLALAFAFVAGRGRWLLVPLAAAAFALAVVHPTYVIFVAVPLAGFLAVRLLVGASDEGGPSRIAAALGAVAVPSGLFFLWLLPVVRSTASHTPSAQARESHLAHYAGQTERVGDAFRLAPEVITRRGAVVVAALAVVPLVALAARRRWGAFVLGGVLAILSILVVPTLFTAFSDAVSLSQSRRLGGFLPIPFALAAAAFLLARLRILAVAAALAAGIALRLVYPGEFTYRLNDPGPGWPVWLALLGGALALAVWTVVRLRRRDVQRDPLERLGPAEGRSPAWAAATVAAFVLPVGVSGLSALEADPRTSRYELTRGAVAALRDLEPREVVFADAEVSYRVAAYAPLYVVAAPPGHVADTEENRPYERRRDVVRFFARADVDEAERRRILADSGADWLLVDKRRPYPERLVRSFPTVYEDRRFVLVRVRS